MKRCQRDSSFPLPMPVVLAVSTSILKKNGSRKLYLRCQGHFAVMAL